MNTRQDELDRPTTARPVQRAHGSLMFMLIVSAVLTAGWSISWEWRTKVELAAQPHAISKRNALSGTPEDVVLERSMTGGYEEARRLNAAIPFAQAAGTPAPPFRFVGSIADRNRATDCLAIAAMAEAGNGEDGQRAVIQVVLNRVRHSAFARTICGVVFEGSHRASGCQFTFTCDGALARRYSAASWSLARNRATQALDGRVYAPVGVATHYHTDWVHPYWSAALIKLSRVDTHIFLRWPGQGGDALLSVPYRGNEPLITQLADLPAHSEASKTPSEQVFASQYARDAVLHDVVVRNEDGGAFVLLAGAFSATSAREMGRGICMDRPSCKVFGWFDRAAIPDGYPVSSSARAKLGFSYFRDAHNNEIVLFDCARFANVMADGCLPPIRSFRGAASAEPALSLVSR